MRSILRALGKQPPKFTVDFVEEQLKNGNSRSLQFCNSICDAGFSYLSGSPNRVSPVTKKFQQAFAARLSVLLPLAIKKQPNVGLLLISTAGSLPRKELLTRNPNLDRLVTKWFWEQTEESDVESEDSKLYRSTAGGRVW